jgi:hypothetical protein
MAQEPTVASDVLPAKDTLPWSNQIAVKQLNDEAWRAFSEDNDVIVVKYERHGGDWTQVGIEKMTIDRIYFESWK